MEDIQLVPRKIYDNIKIVMGLRKFKRIFLQLQYKKGQPKSKQLVLSKYSQMR